MAHSRYTVEAMRGQAVDRHLLGLRCVLQPGEHHELFTHPIVKESTNFRLSTSGLSSGEHYNGTGFGAVAADGYGTNYCIGTSRVKFGIESKRQCRETSTRKFRQAVVDAFGDMKLLCDTVHGSRI